MHIAVPGSSAIVKSIRFAGGRAKRRDDWPGNHRVGLFEKGVGEIVDAGADLLQFVCSSLGSHARIRVSHR